MNVEHLNQMDNHVFIVEFFVQQVELHEEIQHVDDVEQYLQNQGVILDAAVVDEKLYAG